MANNQNQNIVSFTATLLGELLPVPGHAGYFILSSTNELWSERRGQALRKLKANTANQKIIRELAFQATQTNGE